ncbi:hypothetical protein [Lacibacter sediminis]|uniref:DUF4834 family protein n=1 Tax=Lacibacter sediminis TaxID=2760713 RepID=A0A7G5XFE1_9BACT|nr:hypothetical protein [Lacibacter sediminis]QNA44194.1 hypothetical protein H4075_19305 [Lacibacter sediminis]
MLLRYLLYGLLIYFVFRFIFRFVIPVTRAARTMKSKMNEFQTRMQEQQQQQAAAQRPQPVKEPLTPKEGDYIEFEEVK